MAWASSDREEGREISRELFPLHSKDPALRLRKGEGTEAPCVCAEEWLFFSIMVDTSYEMMTSKYG